MSFFQISEICLALVICFVLTLYYLTRQRLVWKWPIFGEILPLFLVNMHQTQDQLVKVFQHKNGTFVLKGPWLANMDLMFSVDPANIHYITTTNFSNYPKGPQHRKIFAFMGNAMFNSDGDLFRFHQRTTKSHMSNPDFISNVVRITYGKVESGLVPLIDDASKNGLIMDMQDVFKRFTWDVSCIVSTGHDPGSLSLECIDAAPPRALAEALQGAVYRFVLPEMVWKLQCLLGIGQENKLRQATKVIDHFIFSIITKKRQDLRSKYHTSSKEGEGVDFLTTYMKESEKQGDNTNNVKFLRDSVLSLLLAGQGTISSALTWSLWLIVRNPEVQEKIREELRANIPTTEANKWHVFQADETNKLVYLHAALCESLRLYPPAPFQNKSPTQPDVLPSGHHVHPKMTIILSLYPMARMNSIWGENCSKFEPERWISEQGRIKHEPSYKFFSFYDGPRACLGKGAAFYQLKMVAATLIHNYQFQVLEDHNIHPNFSALLYMKHGLKVKVQSRWTRETHFDENT